MLQQCNSIGYISQWCILKLGVSYIVTYHSVDTTEVISLVNSQKGYFRFIQDFLEVLCITNSPIIQLLYSMIT